MNEKYWFKGNTQGIEPLPRFGHSTVYHQETHSLIITGGSNGNDLIRNGNEFQDIYILSIVKSQTNQSDILIWSKPILNSIPSKMMMNMDPEFSDFSDFSIFSSSSSKAAASALYTIPIPGRCHSANLIGNKIILFGGGGSTQEDQIILLSLSYPALRNNHSTHIQSNGFINQNDYLIDKISISKPLFSNNYIIPKPRTAHISLQVSFHYIF